MKLHLGERWRKKVKSFNTRLFFTRILFNNIFPIIFQIEISYTIHYTVFYAIQHLQIIHQNPPFTRILEYWNTASDFISLLLIILFNILYRI